METLEFVQALYDFNQDGSSPGCMKFLKDDYLRLLERRDGGWWQGVDKKDQENYGWFPTGYVRIVDDPIELSLLMPSAADAGGDLASSTPTTSSAGGGTTASLSSSQSSTASTSSSASAAAATAVAKAAPSLGNALLGSSSSSLLTGDEDDGSDETEDNYSENTTQHAVATSDYLPNAYEDDGLAFRKGDHIVVTNMSPTGRWQGTLNGKTGYFPSRHVRLEVCLPY